MQALLLLLALGQAAPELESLAAERLWDEVMDRAGERLAADPDDRAAIYWLGRAGYERALRLLEGDAFSRDLGAALLGRAIEQLGRVASAESSAGGPPDDAREWWYAARHALGDAQLAGELEVAWQAEGDAFAAYLRGAIAAGDERPSAPEGADAVTWFRRASDAAPERARFAFALADALAAGGERRGALAAWERAGDAGAALPDMLAMLLSILPGLEHAAERLERLDGLLERPDASDDAQLAWHRAYALDQLGRLPEAERAFARGTRGRTADIDRAHARLLLRLDRHREAGELLLPRAAERDWESFTALVDVADSLALARRFDEALGFYDAALAIEGRDERPLRNRALTLWRAGRDEEAAAAWRRVLELLPGRADILNDAALAAGAGGRSDESKALLEEAAVLPGSEDARENLATWLLRQPDPDVEAAVTLLDGVLAVEPDRDRALYLRFAARRGSNTSTDRPVR